jgi:SNF2 family DNA or RNA helicase
LESKVVGVKLSEAERDFYNALLEKSQDIFDGFIKAGTASKSWFAIFSLLHRLRMACDHIALTVKSHIDEEDWNIAVAASNERAAPVPKIGSPTKASNGNGTVDDAVSRTFWNFNC